MGGQDMVEGGEFLEHDDVEHEMSKRYPELRQSWVERLEAIQRAILGGQDMDENWLKSISIRNKAYWKLNVKGGESYGNY